jgi:hypothetical protein
MLFTKESLSGKSYNWSDESISQKFNDSPSRMRFDRFSGDCILHMLNLFDKLIAKISIDEGHKIEDLIMNELPLEAKSEMSVFNWLKARFSQIQFETKLDGRMAIANGNS